MYSQKSLGLPDRFEAPHPSLPYSGRFMRLLCPIVRVLIGDMEKYVNHFAVLVYGSPEIMLLAINFDEDFINEEGIAVAPVLSF